MAAQNVPRGSIVDHRYWDLKLDQRTLIRIETTMITFLDTPCTVCTIANPADGCPHFNPVEHLDRLCRSNLSYRVREEERRSREAQMATATEAAKHQEMTRRTNEN